MKERAKKLWVEAARSGNYKPGRHALYNKETDCYCFLGVLAEVYKHHNPHNYGLDLENYGRLPYVVKKWAGLEYYDPFLKVEIKRNGKTLTVPFSITELNDERGFTFEQLADLVEQQL